MVLTFGVLTFGVLTLGVLAFGVLIFGVLTLRVLPFGMLIFGVLTLRVLIFNGLTLEVLTFRMLTFRVLTLGVLTLRVLTLRVLTLRVPRSSATFSQKTKKPSDQPFLIGYNTTMNKNTYLVELAIQSEVFIRVQADNHEEAERIARDNFYKTREYTIKSSNMDREVVRIRKLEEMQ